MTEKTATRTKAPKQPQDHKAKEAQQAEATEETLITVTVQGVTVTFDREDLDDYDTLELLANSVYPKAGPRIFGEKQWKEILAHLRDENGKLKMSTVDSFINEVFEEAGSGNS